MPSNILIFTTFIFLLLAPPFSTGLVAKPECQDRCGDLTIPYPFGIGPGCSFDPSFDIICNDSSLSQKAYISVIDKEVIEINTTYIRVKYPNLFSVCYDVSGGTGMGMNATAMSYKESASVNLSGTPFTLSYRNTLTAIGCDDMVIQSNGSWSSGGCSAFCENKNDTGGVGFCPYNTSLGHGCCEDYIYGDSSVAAKLIDMSAKLGRRRVFPCSYAFIRETMYRNQSLFSYPLYYLHNSTAFLNDNWASVRTPPLVRLDWTITGAENCSRAQLNSTTYACQDNKSLCVDGGDLYDYYDITAGGYICTCVPGYEGNPYLPGGCQAISFSSSIAESGCPDQCGEISIPFPFGVGPNCYSAPSFEIICNASTNPPIAYLAILKARIYELNSSWVVIDNPYQMGIACYNLSDYRRGLFTVTEERTLTMNLSGTQYTLSDQNWIYVLGCDDMVVGTLGQSNASFVGSSCTSFCWDRATDDDNLYCPYLGDRGYGPGEGCCSAPIPQGTTFLEAKLSDLSGQRQPRSKIFSCSYVYVNKYSYDFPRYILDNSTSMFDRTLQGRWGTLKLDWRIGVESCNEAKQDESTYACGENSVCVDLDAKIGGYICNCSEGFRGNPYLPKGCQDIDECADNATNPCHSNASCNNTQGSADCLCPKGYYGNGRKDGIGCIHLPHSISKQIIILIGMGSGLGFLLLISVVLWLYKVWKKREENLVKQKFFKRNGGLILQQQTDEGAVRKTKVFLANELKVATDHFNESRILGQGGQGTVYKGMLSDGKIVAIKKSKLVEENQLEQFINEVVILLQINHRNVVKLLGCCLETEVPLLVYEFMPNGTLYDLIHDPTNEFPFPWNMRLKIAADIAGALAYLHSASSMPIYHRDIKSSNLLLDDKYIVKVSDFGISRSVAPDQTHLTTIVKGTFGYLDPEYFRSGLFTEKSDVYSFGVVLAELLTGKRPIAFDKTEEERGLAAWFLRSMEENDLDAILDHQILEHGSTKEVIIQVARLAQRCLNFTGRMRPSMREVATELESLKISQTIVGVQEEFEETRNFEDLPNTISDSEYTSTASYKSAKISSLDTHPLMSTIE